MGSRENFLPYRLSTNVYDDPFTLATNDSTARSPNTWSAWASGWSDAPANSLPPHRRDVGQGMRVFRARRVFPGHRGFSIPV